MVASYHLLMPRKPRCTMNYWTERGMGGLCVYARGVYALNEGLSKQMIDVETLVPGGVLCLYSAWSHHELTTQIPQAYYIAVERSRKIILPDFPPIELSFMLKNVHELGV